MPLHYEIFGLSFSREEFLTLLTLYGVVLLAVLAIRLILYVFGSLGLHTLATRRKLRHPWLSWVPVARGWVLGSLSDQYQHLVRQKTTGRRRILAWTWALTGLFGAAILGLYLGIAIHSLAAGGDLLSLGQLSVETMGHAGLLSIVLAVLLTVTGFWALIVNYMAMFDVYTSCDPDSRTAFLVLSILITPLAAIFLFADRKKDRGMGPDFQE